MNDWVSLATDLSANYNLGVEPSSSLDLVVPALPTEDFQGLSFNRPETGWCSPVITACEVRVQTVTGVAGPRFHFGTGKARPFFHIMAGATRSLRKIGFFAHTSTNLTLQPGGGVDVDMSELTAFRIQADYRLVMFPEPDQTGSGAGLVSKDGADYKDFTFSIGMVFKLGERQ